MDEDKCTDCKGTGKQVFHGHFESVMGKCNFCKGSGKREDQDETYSNFGKRKNNKVVEDGQAQGCCDCFYSDRPQSCGECEDGSHFTPAT